MSHHLDDDDDDLNGHQTHREVTLSATAVLGIFFGLVLLCALFFGFGYNMGSKAHQAAQTASTDSPDTASSTTNFNSFKPAPGSTTGQAPVVYPPAQSAAGTITTPPPTTPASTPAPPAAHNEATNQESPTEPSAPRPAPIRLPSVATPPTPAPTVATGTFVVQVAAVSHQEDADLLAGALRGKGYAVAAHTEPQDKLIHIQVGPFSNRAAADAMRQRLLSDGYNAIVK